MKPKKLSYAAILCHESPQGRPPRHVLEGLLTLTARHVFSAFSEPTQACSNYGNGGESNTHLEWCTEAERAI